VLPTLSYMCYVMPPALAVWKMARRERLLSAKITKLAGSPCTYEPVSVPFSISSNNDAGVSSGCAVTKRNRHDVLQSQSG
jgi:hypothetical protein